MCVKQASEERSRMSVVNEQRQKQQDDDERLNALRVSRQQQTDEVRSIARFNYTLEVRFRWPNRACLVGVW